MKSLSPGQIWFLANMVNGYNRLEKLYSTT